MYNMSLRKFTIYFPYLLIFTFGTLTFYCFSWISRFHQQNCSFKLFSIIFLFFRLICDGSIGNSSDFQQKTLVSFEISSACHHLPLVGTKIIPSSMLIFGTVLFII